MRVKNRRQMNSTFRTYQIIMMSSVPNDNSKPTVTASAACNCTSVKFAAVRTSER